MRNSNNIIKKIDRAIDAQKPINIHTENLELCMKSTLPYFLFYRYKNKPHNELRELLQAFSSSFMIQDDYENLEEIVGVISHSISKIFNAFLIIELIPADNDQEIEIISRYDEEDITINTLKKALEDLEINDLSVSIKHEDKSTVKPPLSEIGRKDKGIFWIGLYLPVSLLSDHKSNSLPEHLTDAFKKVVFTFIRIQTSNHFSHYLMHDNDMLDKNVEKIDKELADISDELSFLLNTTPVNDQAAWEEFESYNYKKEPQFTYRMIKFDPEKIKERLFRLEMDNIKGTTAGYILRQKRIQLEVELTLLQSREAVGAKYLGHYLYDVPDDKELEAAKEILDKIKDNSEDDEEKVDCHEFAKIAQSEIDYLKKVFKNENIA